MTKRQTGMATSLAMWKFANQMDERNRNEKPWGLERYTFWLSTGPRDFKTTKEIRDLARQIAKSARTA